MSPDIGVELLLFAHLRELCDYQGKVLVEVPDGASPAICFDVLCEQFPGIGGLRATLAVAVNEEYTGWDHVLRQGDVLSFIPPVSGG
jgi:molybdopterin converting factor small subunit